MTVSVSAPATPVITPWGTVFCISLAMFVLIASEFLPVSLLTPIAHDLGITEGQAGQAVSFSGFFAVATSLFGNLLLARLDRRLVLLFYTAVLIASALAIALAPNYLVFMIGRALIGMSIGGYISLTTAILAPLVRSDDLPKALAMLQGGSALASVIAQPLGSFAGGLIGWRGAFLCLVPLCLIVLVWQALVLPRIPANQGSASVTAPFRLLGDRKFALGMTAMTLFFVGQFALSTYLRPFLETVTQTNVSGISLMLFGLGLAGLAGTTLIGFVLRAHLYAILMAFPAALCLVAFLLITLGASTPLTAVLLVLWGFLVTPIPVAWNTWMTRVIPDKLEAGGGLLVALIQAAITFGAFTGGMLFDNAGVLSPFAYSGVMFLASALLAVVVTGGRWRH